MRRNQSISRAIYHRQTTGSAEMEGRTIDSSTFLDSYRI